MTGRGGTGSDATTAQKPLASAEFLHRRVRLYPADFKGPLYVYFRALEGKSINQVSLANILYKVFKSVVEIKKVFADKIRVIFSDVSEANKCVSDKAFAQYRVYIQSKIVEVDGVVILEYDEDEKVILSGTGRMESLPNVDIKILEVYRMRKKIRGDSMIVEKPVNGDEGEIEGESDVQMEQGVKWVPAKAVRVTFQGTLLPDYVKIQGLIVKVHAFNPRVMFCENCLRYGHTKVFCNNKTRCGACGSVHGVGDKCVEDKFQCPNCNKKFDKKEHKCPARAVFVDNILRKAQVRHNISFAGIVKGDQSSKRQREDENLFEVLSDLESDLNLDSDTEYPEISSAGRFGKKRNKKSKSAFDKARKTQKEFHRRELRESGIHIDPISSLASSSDSDGERDAERGEGTEDGGRVRKIGSAWKLQADLKKKAEKDLRKKSEDSEKVKERDIGKGSSSWKELVLLLLRTLKVSAEFIDFIEGCVFPALDILIPRFMPMLSEVWGNKQ